jgi:hypothetical protein
MHLKQKIFVFSWLHVVLHCKQKNHICNISHSYRSITETMMVIKVQRKGKHLNTLERYHIHTRACVCMSQMKTVFFKLIEYKQYITSVWIPLGKKFLWLSAQPFMHRLLFLFIRMELLSSHYLFGWPKYVVISCD